MGIKQQLGMGVTTAVLGLTLIGGGTFAYFSDSSVTNNTFAAGTLDLDAEPTTVIDVDNLKPGDSMIRDFELQNNGSLAIDTVTLDTDYNVIDVEGNNTEDFGDFIEVEFLYNANNLDEVIYQTTLSELEDMSPEAISQHIFYPELGDDGLPVGESHDLVVAFNFLGDVDADLNQFQGDSLELEWTFTATQMEGEQR
ncbi:spore coat-associated protein N [Geomicrobium halophilum]|uniref:Spore coat-associated protein N n=1 Tax=Geomicrobium halophilum TaxID=549000 RepID=A0A841PV11_9BACL|nr:CalY family protein [Geomicrobium halophilum]MBB6450141.1 spore coat-associated protein N [Geomicrobium halophilum]MBB6450143.1 spore coat-associated protein N [Geomicrobium halophilum]